MMSVIPMFRQLTCIRKGSDFIKCHRHLLGPPFLGTFWRPASRRKIVTSPAELSVCPRAQSRKPLVIGGAARLFVRLAQLLLVVKLGADTFRSQLTSRKRSCRYTYDRCGHMALHSVAGNLDHSFR